MEEKPQVQVSVGREENDERGRLAFTIIAVHEDQKPSTESPFHVKGGEWTYFDCRAGTDPVAEFTVGVWPKRRAAAGPVAWGKAALVVKDRESGRRFVEVFGKSFPGKNPTPVDRQYVPGPLLIGTAILGDNLNRHAQSGFSGEGGGWTATKWFPEHDTRSAEVYVNYNLARRQGEFLEKDNDYANELQAIFASAFRDGPRPERTPENDPNFTLTAPTIGQPRRILPRRCQHSFSPDSRFAVYVDGSTIFALPLDRREARAVEIARFENEPWEVRVLDGDLTCLVQEVIPQKPGSRSTGDPMRFWWVDPKNGQKKLLREPETSVSLEESPVSPDHRHVALDQWVDNPDGKGRSKMVHFLDREGGTSKVIKLPGKAITVVSWKKTDEGPRAVVVTNRWRLDERQPAELYLADPSTGKLERQENVDARAEIDNVLSPDGKHRVRVGKDELVVTDVASGKGRRFVFHEDDQRFVGQECVKWVSPRYLRFLGPRLTLIDVPPMKLCYPSAADGSKLASGSYDFSPDFRWVMYNAEQADGEGFYLAPVEMPRE